MKRDIKPAADPYDEYFDHTMGVIQIVKAIGFALDCSE
jgi:hypothetical protein